MNVPPGFTRSSIHVDHALVAPDSHVLSPLPGWGGAQGIILVSPQMGARFTMYIAQMDGGVVAGAPAPGMQRFVYVLEGSIDLADSAGTIPPDAFAYFPPDHPTTFASAEPSRVVVFEKPYTPVAGVPRPQARTGRVAHISGEPFLGDPDALLKVLLPAEESFDMAVNLFTFQPGATLPFVESHVMEHGLLFLQGGGVYRLSDQWYPVTRGDVIWMAPYCQQWFIAGGKTPSAYLYYKDVHRDPLVME